jgi:nitric oxide reductase NorE protein
MDDQAKPQLAGDLAMWIFIYAELLVFGIFFIGYAFTRAYNIELFNAGQATLDKELGAFNTLVLITGSYCVVRAVTAIRQEQSPVCVRWLGAALASGLLFLIVKVFEYKDKLAAGYDLDSNLFFMFYFSLTFFHFMHVILGMVILGFVLLKTQRGGYSASEHRGLESAASYWHMVDLVWVVLFPLLYILK